MSDQKRMWAFIDLPCDPADVGDLEKWNAVGGDIEAERDQALTDLSRCEEALRQVQSILSLYLRKIENHIGDVAIELPQFDNFPAGTFHASSSAAARRGIELSERLLSNKGEKVCPECDRQQPGNYCDWCLPDEVKLIPALRGKR